MYFMTVRHLPQLLSFEFSPLIEQGLPHYGHILASTIKVCRSLELLLTIKGYGYAICARKWPCCGAPVWLGYPRAPCGT